MDSQVRLDSLLFSNDAQVIAVMNEILQSLSIEMELCNDFHSALDAVAHRRLDAVIVDWESEQIPTRIVRAVRTSSPNSNSTIVALVNASSETHALLVGANFMIHKPANLAQAKRCMRAAYGTMLQTRRRAARVPADIAVIARVADVGEVHGRICDISVSGLALLCNKPLHINREVLVQFPLPGMTTVIHVTGKIVNANATGRAGIRFTFVPEDDLIILEEWLAIELANLEKAELPRDQGSD